MLKTEAKLTESNRMSESDQAAIAIYVMMSRDPVDALEMIDECNDARTLEMLLAMLRQHGTNKTDRELNTIFDVPVSRRLSALGGKS